MSSTGDAGHEAGAAAYSATQRHALLAIARASIEHGLERGRPLPVSLDGLEPALTSPRATFVTLKRRGALRGCIGTLRAELPLARDVAERAYAAAFRDPRFPPVTRAEWSRPGFTLSVSVLSPPSVPLPTLPFARALNAQLYARSIDRALASLASCPSHNPAGAPSSVSSRRILGLPVRSASIFAVSKLASSVGQYTEPSVSPPATPKA